MRVAHVIAHLTLCASVGAFAPSQSSLQHSRIPGLLSAFEDPGEASVAEETKPAVAVPVKRNGSSESIPFVKCPEVLLNCDLAGNVGFDPLGLSKNKEQLLEYREAEIKHARLAMLVSRWILRLLNAFTRSEMKMELAAHLCLPFLRSIVIALQAAAGWPLSELLDRSIAEFFGIPSILDQADRVPSILNGGLEQVSPVWWGTCLGLTAAIDMYGISKSRAGDPTYFPGKLGFVSMNVHD